MASSADPDQLASSEANWSGSSLFAKQDISAVSRTRVKRTIGWCFIAQSLSLSSFHHLSMALEMTPLGWLGRKTSTQTKSSQYDLNNVERDVKHQIWAFADLTPSSFIMGGLSYFQVRSSWLIKRKNDSLVSRNDWLIWILKYM